MLKKGYQYEDGIYIYTFADKTVKKIKDFYQDDPFPNYEINDDKAILQKRGDSNTYTRELKNYIGYGKKIIEIGAGTCQLSNYLAIGTNNSIVALDANFNSLKLGKDFAVNNDIKNVSFVCADIFDDRIEQNSFDFVICNGVLHHTKNSYQAFEHSRKLLKKDGYILVGLYNYFGRFRTKVRGFFYRIFGKKFVMILDPVLRKIKKKSLKKIDAWIKDQYIHPVERSHTYDEVLSWFDKSQTEFISSHPSCEFFLNNQNLNDLRFLFISGKTANFFERLLTQIFMIFGKTGSEGGLFFFLGKKTSK